MFFWGEGAMSTLQSYIVFFFFYFTIRKEKRENFFFFGYVLLAMDKTFFFFPYTFIMYTKQVEIVTLEINQTAKYIGKEGKKQFSLAQYKAKTVWIKRDALNLKKKNLQFRLQIFNFFGIHHRSIPFSTVRRNFLTAYFPYVISRGNKIWYSVFLRGRPSCQTWKGPQRNLISIQKKNKREADDDRCTCHRRTMW